MKPQTVSEIIEVSAGQYTKALAASMAQTKEIISRRLWVDEMRGFMEYRLEQCGKLYRVKKAYWSGEPEYVSGWLKLNEAQAIMKLMGNDDGNS